MALKTFNVPDCKCGKNHDSLQHIAKGALYLVLRGEMDVATAAAQIEKAAIDVGWTHPEITENQNG